MCIEDTAQEKTAQVLEQFLNSSLLTCCGKTGSEFISNHLDLLFTLSGTKFLVDFTDGAFKVEPQTV